MSITRDFLKNTSKATKSPVKDFLSQETPRGYFYTYEDPAAVGPPVAPEPEDTSVGAVEGVGRGILGGLVSTGAFLQGAIVDPVANAVEFAEAGLTGREPQYRSRYAEGLQAAQNITTPEGREVGVAGQIGLGAGQAVAMIPEMFVGGPAQRVVRAGEQILDAGAQTWRQFAANQLEESARASAVIAPRMSSQTAVEAEQAGATPTEALAAGLVELPATVITNTLPIAAAGRLGTRLATGAVGGVAAEAGVQGAVNPLLPEELAAQRDLTDPTNLTTAAGLGALMGAAFGTRPAPRLSDAARDLAAMRDAEVARGIEAAQQQESVRQAELAIAELNNLTEKALNRKKGGTNPLFGESAYPRVEEPAPVQETITFPEQAPLQRDMFGEGLAATREGVEVPAREVTPPSEIETQAANLEAKARTVREATTAIDDRIDALIEQKAQIVPTGPRGGYSRQDRVNIQKFDRQILDLQARKRELETGAVNVEAAATSARLGLPSESTRTEQETRQDYLNRMQKESIERARLGEVGAQGEPGVPDLFQPTKPRVRAELEPEQGTLPLPKPRIRVGESLEQQGPALPQPEAPRPVQAPLEGPTMELPFSQPKRQGADFRDLSAEAEAPVREAQRLGDARKVYVQDLNAAKSELTKARNEVTKFNKADQPVPQDVLDRAEAASLRVREAEFTLGRFDRLSKRNQAKGATTPAPAPKTAPTAPLTRAERVAQQRTVAEQVLNPVTGQMETVVEAAVSPDDTRRKDVESFFSGATPEQTAAVQQDQANNLTNRAVDPRLEAAAAAIANRTVPPEQRRVTPLRAALGRAKTAWDALAGVRAAVARGENPNIERYDRLIQVLSTEDMKDVEFKLLQPETEATTEAQRRVKEGVGIDKYTKGLHEVDNATGKQSVVITGDGYAGRDGTKSVETTLHEIVHAKTAKAIRDVKEGREKDPRIVKAVNDFEAIRGEVRKADRKDLTRDEAEAIDYATTNTDEFLSGTMTNPLVQSALKKEGFWKRIVNTIRIIVRAPRSQKAVLDEILDSAYAIVDVVNTVNAERGSSSKTSGNKKPRVLFHGTTVEGAQSILSSGKFSPESGQRVYDYSEFGEGTIYLGTKESKWIANKSDRPGDTGWDGRTATYPEQVGAIVSPDANIVLIEDGMDVQWLEAQIGYEGEAGRLLQDLAADSLREKSGWTEALSLPENAPERQGLSNEEIRQIIRDIDKNNSRSKALIDRLVRAGIDGIEIVSEDRLDDRSFYRSAPTPDQIAIFNPDVVRPVTREEAEMQERSASQVNRSVATPTKPDVAQARKQVLGQDRTVTSRLASKMSPFSKLGIVARKVDHTISRLFFSERGSTRTVEEVMGYKQGVLERVSAEAAPFVNRLRALLRQLPKDKRAEGASDIDRILKGEIELKDSKVLTREMGPSIDQVRKTIDKFTNEIGQEVVRSYGGRDMPKSTLRLLETLKANLGSYVARTYMSDQDKTFASDLWGRYKKGDESAVEVVQPLVNKLSAEIASLPDLLRKAREEAQDLSNQRTTFEPEDTFLGSELRRLYENYIGSSSGRTKEDMLSALTTFSNQAKDITAEAERVTQEIMGVGQAASPLSQYYRGLRSNDQPLRKRSAVPKEIRDVWGEITDPLLNAINTTQRMGALLSGLKASNMLAEMAPESFTERFNADSGQTFQIPNNPLAYGKLAGMYTDEGTFHLVSGQMEMAASLLYGKPLDAGKTGQAVGRFVAEKLAKVTSLQKMMSIVLNPFVAISNVFNVAYMPLVNGNANAELLPKALKIASRMVGSASRLDETDPELLEILEQGIIDPVLTQADTVLQERKQEARTLRKESTALNALADAKKTFFDTYDTLKETISFLETVPKIWNYLSHKETFKKMYPEMGEADIKRLAAEETNRLNLTYARVPDVLRMTETAGISYVAGYMQQVLATSIYSVSSGARQAVEGIRSGNKELAMFGIKKLGGSVAGFTLASYIPQFVAEAMDWIDLSDEEDEDKQALLETLAFTERGMQPMIMGVTPEGVVTHTDVGRLNPYDSMHSVLRALVASSSAVARGDSEQAEANLKSAVENLAGQFAGGSPLGGLLLRTVQGKAPPSAMEADAKQLHDSIVLMGQEVGLPESATSNLVNAAWTFTPAFVRGIARAGQLERTNPEAFADNLVAGATMLRAPVRTHDPFNNLSRVAQFEYKPAVNRDNLREVLLLESDVSREQIERTVGRIIDEEAEAFNNLVQGVRAARYVGRLAKMPESEINNRIREGLEAGGIAKTKARSFVQETTPYEPTIIGGEWGKEAIETYLRGLPSREFRNQRRQQLEQRLALINEVVKEMQPRRTVTTTNTN